MASWKPLGERPARSRLRGISRATVLAALSLAALAPSARCQLPTVTPAPAWRQVPSGEGACSIGKSCAELAPDLIHNAEGESPLAANVSALAKIGPRVSGTPAALDAANWAVDAFRRAGADDARIEKFPLRSGQTPVSENVVAEIRGYEKSGEWVLIAARLDSTASPEDSLAGAGTVAALIDAVRVIHSSGSVPRRTIRFVLFTGSEGGGQGVRAYVAAHRDTLDGLIAAVFFPPGAGAIHGYSLDGRGDTLAAVRETLEPAAPVGIKEFTVDAPMNAETLAFILEGVPTLAVRQDPSRGPSASPLAPETIVELKRHSAIAAVTAYGLANGAGRIGARQSRVQVGELLEKTGLDRQMKAAGLWNGWANGERGLPK